jgi:hypothetical protein
MPRTARRAAIRGPGAAHVTTPWLSRQAAERMLSAQAAALNAIFGERARRAARNLGEYLGAAEIYLRRALFWDGAITQPCAA